MSLQCGIVGLPNVGKSTLFNALTKAGIAAENYPFCTIEPNVGVVEVPGRAAWSTGRDRASRSASCRPSSSSSTSRAWLPGASQGRRPGQSVPRPHPRDRRDRQRGALLRGRQRDPRRRQGRPDLRHRGDPDRAVPGRPGDGRKGSAPLHQDGALGRQGSDQAGRVAREVPGRTEREQAGARHRLQQGRASR